jgi:hypothetical protein
MFKDAEMMFSIKISKHCLRNLTQENGTGLIVYTKKCFQITCGISGCKIKWKSLVVHYLILYYQLLRKA